MAVHPLSFRVAQAIGLTGAAWLSGNIAALSMNTIPALIRSHHEDNAPPKLLVTQWRNIFEAGKTQNPPIAALTAAAFFYLAWSVRSGRPFSRKVKSYATAGALTLGIVPYTIIFMSRTNNSLLEVAGSGAELSEKASVECGNLLDRWVTLNGIRSLLPLAGGVIGIIAAIV